MIESKHQTKILILDEKITYAWVYAKDIGEILVAAHKPHELDCILAIGTYHIYEVIDEPSLSDQMHIELSVGGGVWQGYLLPTGLPTEDKKRNRIIPTREVVHQDDKYCDICGVDE